MEKKRLLSIPMKRDYHQWWSPRLDRSMELLVFGHGGARVLVFPTRGGCCFEHENLGITDWLRCKIENGHLQLFCLDSVDAESFYCWWAHPSGRIQRHLAYEAYILEEVFPFMNRINPHPCTISHGCSLGAYHATNLALRHPLLFNKLAAFSGRYDLTKPVDHFEDLLGGYYDDDVYFNMPLHFLPGLTDPATVEAIRHLDVVLAVGREDPFLSQNEELAELLRQKGAHVDLHYWDGEAHQGGAWRRMAGLYL
jgi:esterase/lipase superfamily enzyme